MRSPGRRVGGGPLLPLGIGIVLLLTGIGSPLLGGPGASSSRAKAPVDAAPATLRAGAVADAPAWVSVVNATSTTLTVRWGAANATGVTGYLWSVYADLTCLSSPIASGEVNGSGPLVAVVSGLTASTPYSVGVAAIHATGISPATCGASANGAGVTTAPYAGWSYWYRNYTWTNYSLPTSGADAWPGTRGFFAVQGGFDSPVVSLSNPSGDPMIYYVDATGNVSSYDMRTGATTTLPDQSSPMVPPIEIRHVINGEPTLLLPYITARNEVTALYDCSMNTADGAPVADLMEVIYWLTNDTETVLNSSLPISSTGSGSCGLMPGGWAWYVGPTNQQLEVVNVWSDEIRSSSTEGVSAWGDWNSAAYVVTANQVVVDVNTRPAGGVDVRAFSFNESTGAFAVRTLTRALWAISAADTNNLNYYYRPDNGGTELYGLGENGGSLAYHLLEVQLGSSVGGDSIAGLYDTGPVGTTDTTDTALPAPWNFTLNGAVAATRGAGPQQAPLLDPIHGVSVWAGGMSPSSRAFDASFDACLGFCATQPWANAWSYVPGDWNASPYVLGATEFPSGTNSTGGVFELYGASLAPPVGLYTGQGFPSGGPGASGPPNFAGTVCGVRGIYCLGAAAVGLTILLSAGIYETWRRRTRST